MYALRMSVVNKEATYLLMLPHLHRPIPKYQTVVGNEKKCHNSIQ